MTNSMLITFGLMLLIVGGCRCRKEVQCFDKKIQPAFVGFQPSEIDTLIIRKFQASDNFQKRLDSFTIFQGDAYRTAGDTTKIVYYPLENGIVTGFDWQIFIPALNRTILISEILSNKKTIECGTLARDCGCANDLLSAKVNDQPIPFPKSDFETPFIYIRK